ncbi:redox-sensing transcriptional repressor Rex [Thermosipho atlanticus]|uniref:Redox-sensing transcriptional repressor Rex n=1 Tax=Thermosipho atlanticus DSM 15807 TaxID=1123380 RepID=A0A1M5T8I2_9BACT|nr:redox-sensing transcriptional repressor Rex [Thermosipho atlanticus]SHH47075.1 redox-sensing transcriptional repressor [Thermosipho atlanticus DSM 15807]
MSECSNNKKTLMFPKPTLERLKLYLALLLQEEKEYISSDEIAKKLKITPEQVRKDISYLNFVGKPKVGYHIPSLLNELNELFGVDVTDNVIVVGAGGLGTAIAKYKGFKRIGIDIVAIFDNDEDKIGTFVSELVVLPLSELQRVIKRFKVKIAALCVPKESAQEAADLLVKSGIKAIWNFAPAILHVPPGILVENEDITRGILSIKHMLEKNK